MPRYIVKLTDAGRDYYLEWSTIVDAPVTSGMSLKEFRSHYQQEYGREGIRGLDERMNRVESTGTSSHHHDSAEDTISCNRAGDGETRLTMEQIIDHYCRGNPIQRGADPFEGEDEEK